MASCSEDSNEIALEADDFVANQGQLNFAPLMKLTDVIQHSEDEHLDLAKIQDILDNIQQVEINEMEVSIYLVELNLSFNTDNLKRFKELLNHKYGNALIDNKLSSWYIHTSSGKELEISIIEEAKNQASLRYLIRSYL